MTEVVATRIVPVPPDEAWDLLADFGSIARWAPNVDHSCLMSDQIEGPGTVRRIQTGRTTVVERVTDWVAPTTLAYRIEGLPPIVGSVVNRWTIAATDGGTTVTLTSTIDAGPRPPQRVAARAAGRRLAGAGEHLLDGLAGHLTRSKDAADG